MAIPMMQVARNEGEAYEFLRRHQSYIGAVDLSETGLDQQGGLEYPYPGFGFYMSFQGTAPGAQLRVFFDRDFTKSILVRPGTYFKPGPIDRDGRRAHSYFDRLYIQRTADSAVNGLANLVMLGTPEAEYSEESTAVAATSIDSGIQLITDEDLVVFGPEPMSNLLSARLYITNLGEANAIQTVQVQISPDGTWWEEVLIDQFSALAPLATRSRTLPPNINFIRVRAQTAANTTGARIWISGRY